MTSILASATQAAHSAAAGLLSKAQIAPGAQIPTGIKVKQSSVETPTEFTITGKSLIVGVPAAFSGTCSNQVPGFVEKLSEFKAKGVNDIYVVAVNDFFVLSAWKEKLKGEGIHFIADDKGELTSALGLLFDASPLLGSPRSKRYVIIANGHTVDKIFVEADPTKYTITSADSLLAHL